jgi:GT2 family glycosyltransferase
MITIVIPFFLHPSFDRTLQQFIQSPLVRRVIVLTDRDDVPAHPKCDVMKAGPLESGRTLNALFSKVKGTYLIFVTSGSAEIELGPGAIWRFLDVVQSTGAGMVYSDYYEVKTLPPPWAPLFAGEEDWLTERVAYPLNDYQPGSIRNDFDFGPLVLFDLRAVRRALRKYGAVPAVRYAGLYDLRLKTSIRSKIFHVSEFLYTRIGAEEGTAGERIFDYVDPRNLAVQKEMEAVATRHLKHIGAWLEPVFKKVPAPAGPYPVQASVIIPVRNRAGTIADAVWSALLQKTDFPFNVIVVDNHSTDGTTDVLARIARRNRALRHRIPSRSDLNIGGCWNEAVYSEDCGRYAVQLDSDDIYSSENTLQKIVNLFRRGRCAMVIGSYTLVNADLEVIPPGLIDHREWTNNNGRNNALRINGLGAPRAFDTTLLRKIGFLNVGYGEDYALALRLSREYRIGRIYENLYLCRRWEGNTDSFLSMAEKNRNDAFKDRIRTIEILARQKLNRALSRG